MIGGDFLRARPTPVGFVSPAVCLEWIDWRHRRRFSCSTAAHILSSSSDEDDGLLHNVGSSSSSDESENELQPSIPRPRPTCVRGTGNVRNVTASDLLWVDVTGNDAGPDTIPIYQLKPVTVLPSCIHAVESLPIEYFNLFFNYDILNYIVDETNLFANNRKSNTNSPRARINDWTDITIADLNAFIGTVINMGTIPLSSIESYFSKKWESRIGFFGDVFSKNDFLKIFWNLHFNHDREGQGPKPRGFLIQPLLDHVRRQCQLFYTTSNNVAVDECTISFKGKVSFRVYNPLKPTKFGLKVFALSDCDNGYLYDFLPYLGMQQIIPDSNLLKTTQIVKHLCESVVYKDPTTPRSGVHVFTDRYYTGPEIASELWKMNTNITGTVMPTRVGMPSKLKATSQKLKKGQILAKRKDNTLVLCWKDKRVVTMLSTFSKGSTDHMTDVPSRWPNKPAVSKPDVVINYTKHMGAVDRTDHFVSSYQFMRRTRKWYRKMFFWLIEIAIINSYILYKINRMQSNLKPMSHFAFRKSLVTSLVAERVSTRPLRKKGRPNQGPPDQRLDGRPHFPGKTSKGRRCVVCLANGVRKETVYMCETCDARPALHPEVCFKVFHTSQNF